MGQIIKSICLCQSVCECVRVCVCASVRLRALSRSHFLINFHQHDTHVALFSCTLCDRDSLFNKRKQYNAITNSSVERDRIINELRLTSHDTQGGRQRPRPRVEAARGRL